MNTLLAALVLAQSLETARVESKPVDRFVTLTAEVLPYQATDLVARVPGYLESISVDRGSVVKKGQTLATLSAPELQAQIAEAQAKVATVRAQAGEARARLAAARSTAERLRAASATPGAVAANEVVLAEESVKAAQAALDTIDLSRAAAEAQVKALSELASFLTVTAPFDGVVTARLLHPGALAGPQAGPLLRLEQVARLRIVVAVPEANVAAVRPGQAVDFTVTAHPGQSFRAAVTRIPRVLDPQTRTMPVELDFPNPAGKIAPGMYTEVKWPAVQGQAKLLVPATAVTSTTERAFVIRVENGLARYVNVKRGPAHGELVEVSGPLAPGDVIVKRATDEIREGARIPGR